jgi:hypothetical protein
MAEKQSFQKGVYWATIVMAICNLVVVVITGLGLYFSQRDVKKQLELTRRFQELQFRPYVLADPTQVSFSFNYRVGRSDVEDAIVIPVESVLSTSNEYLSVRNFYYITQGFAKLRNCGTTPAKIKSVSFSSITAREWNETYKKSFIELVSAIKLREEREAIQPDIIIIQNDSTDADITIGFGRRLPISEFEKLLSSTSAFDFLVYAFVEYEDLSGNRYNTIRMMPLQSTIVQTAGRVSLSVPKPSGPEKYEIDVGLRD